MKKYHLLLAVGLVLALAACKNEESEPERPFYPTEGAINARYTVGDNVTVVFAKGNLQYQASTQTWRFASDQFDYIGLGNDAIAADNQDWIDLFGWGTSGYAGVMPYAATDTNRYYVPVETDINGTNYDWGQFNPIANGGRTAGQWRTLSRKEWNYLLSLRESASVKKGEATILNVDGQGKNAYGVVLLPDKWQLPENCKFQYGRENGFGTNVYTVGEWNLMEHGGAVFLPAAGYRDGTSTSLVGEYGCYWTATYFGDEIAYDFYFQDGDYAISTAARSNGHSVRLVQNK